MTEAHGTTETQVQGGLAAVAGAEAEAQTEAVRRRSVSRVVLVGSRQQPPQVWLGTPTLLLLQVARQSVFVECRQIQLVYPTAWKWAVLYEQVPYHVPLPCLSCNALAYHATSQQA